MRSLIFMILPFLMLYAVSSYASNSDSIFQETTKAAAAFNRDAYQALSHAQVDLLFGKNVSAPQSNYYQGVKDSNISGLQADAESARSTITGDVIQTSIKKHPNYNVKTTDQDILHAAFVEREADNILHGISYNNLNCSRETICRTDYQEMTCTASPKAIHPSCRKILNIDLNPEEAIEHYPLTILIKSKKVQPLTIQIDPVTGSIKVNPSEDTAVQFSGKIPGVTQCQGLSGTLTEFTDYGRNVHIEKIDFPSCANGMKLSFNFTSRMAIQAEVHFDITYKTYRYHPKDIWTDACTALAQNTQCTVESTLCLAPNETRVIEGQSFTRPCWEMKTQYACQKSDIVSNCQTLEANGCEQISSRCQKDDSSQCASFEQIYRCPTKHCALSSNIQCGDGHAFCLDGSCADSHYEPNKDFAKNVSSLSAVNDAAKQFDPNTVTLFSGYPAECSEKPVGYSSCCAEKGWGQDLKLDNCPVEAKKLYQAREKGLATKVDRYCAVDTPFGCLEHAKVFCIYPSKLAKIIQEQGRVQLGMPIDKHCHGLTPTDLQRLDLSRIDFSEFYSDLSSKQKMQDTAIVRELIQKHVEQYKERERE